MALEHRALHRNESGGLDQAADEIKLIDPVDELEVFETHGIYSGAFGGDQPVNARAKVLEHEVLLGRRLALVHLLRPLLERQLDAEGLVDGKGDVEKVEAVDAEIVDGVAVGRDVLTRDVARFGNNIGDRVEGRGHGLPPRVPSTFHNGRQGFLRALGSRVPIADGPLEYNAGNGLRVLSRRACGKASRCLLSCAAKRTVQGRHSGLIPPVRYVHPIAVVRRRLWTSRPDAAQAKRLAIALQETIAGAA